MENYDYYIDGIVRCKRKVTEDEKGQRGEGARKMEPFLKRKINTEERARHRFCLMKAKKSQRRKRAKICKVDLWLYEGKNDYDIIEQRAQRKFHF